MSGLTLYETMSEISAGMVEAAQASDWQRLVSLEQRVASVRDLLDGERSAAELTSAERERKVALIHRILANDAEVRRHTEPWMEQVRRFLNGPAQERNVRRAYGEASGL